MACNRTKGKRLLEEQLESASPDLLRSLLSTFIQTLMSADADTVCGAAYGTSSPERVTTRNGYRHRDFDTEPERSTWPFPSCAPVRTSRTGCSSGAAAPKPR
jgi:transposase-like protein